MKIVSIIAYILAAIFIIFGFLYILGSGSSQQLSWIPIGIFLILIGFGLIAAGYFVNRRATANQQAQQNVTLKVDLPADVNLDTLKCQSCGGALTADNIKMVAGAPMVSCPYCGTTYQLTEEPKW